MNADDDLLRLVYASRNLLPKAEAQQELKKILATARRNNAPLGITGSLLFCDDCFVQVLEGLRPQVEALFERIQRDGRHSHVVVLDASRVRERSFATWSMAYAGSHDDIRYEDFESASGAMPRPGILGTLFRLLGQGSERSDAAA
jgi:hypothetical protein